MGEHSREVELSVNDSHSTGTHWSKSKANIDVNTAANACADADCTVDNVSDTGGVSAKSEATVCLSISSKANLSDCINADTEKSGAAERAETPELGHRRSENLLS